MTILGRAKWRKMLENRSFRRNGFVGPQGYHHGASPLAHPAEKSMVGHGSVMYEVYNKVALRKMTPLAQLVPQKHHSTLQRTTYVLGIETSCDDTAVGIVDSNGRVVSDVVSSQWDMHKEWNGVVPNLAARSHEINLPHVLKQALTDSGLTDWSGLSAIAVTTGPGVAPCLKAGLLEAKRLSKLYDLPFISVNHLEAHVLVARMLNKDLQFPFLVLLVSGGHCQLVVAKDVGQYMQVGSTLDDSIGEAFDKAARMLEIYGESAEQRIHGGKRIEDYAREGNPFAYQFSEPMKNRKDCHFSFSGLKTALKIQISKIGHLDLKTKQDLAASFQRVAVGHLVTRTLRAFDLTNDALIGQELKDLVVCGGVASNTYVRTRIQDAFIKHDVNVLFPDKRYCTDNGVMVAWAGLEKFGRGMIEDSATVDFQPRWPLGPRMVTKLM